MHCFGHIHEGWGAKLVTWRNPTTETPSHFIDIDNEKSVLVDELSGLWPSKFDTPEWEEQKVSKRNHFQKERCYATSHCAGDAIALEHGAQTMFVNAANKNGQEYLTQLPWLVEIELPRAPEHHNS